MKACHVCQKEFVPHNSLVIVCGIRCARQVPVINRKAEKKADRQRREAIKTRSDWMADLEREVNKFARLRDRDKPCVSCGTTTATAWNASHYRSVGSSPELRFDTANIHRSCAQCNLHLHGNLIPYRVELVRRIGQAEVDRLEGPQTPKKYTVPQIREMLAEFRALNREMA